MLAENPETNFMKYSYSISLVPRPTQGLVPFFKQQELERKGTWDCGYITLALFPFTIATVASCMSPANIAVVKG